MANTTNINKNFNLISYIWRNLCLLTNPTINFKYLLQIGFIEKKP